MEDSGQEVDNSTSKFIAKSVYIVGIIVNGYWGLELDDFMGIGLSLIFSFLALRNIHNLKRLKLTIFFIFASILHWFLSVIIWFICCWSF